MLSYRKELKDIINTFQILFLAPNGKTSLLYKFKMYLLLVGRNHIPFLKAVRENQNRLLDKLTSCSLQAPS